MELITEAMKPAIDELQAGNTAVSAAVHLTEHCQRQVRFSLQRQRSYADTRVAVSPRYLVHALCRNWCLLACSVSHYMQVNSLPEKSSRREWYIDLSDKLAKGSPRSQVLTLHHFWAVRQDVQVGGPLSQVEACLQQEYNVRPLTICQAHTHPVPCWLNGLEHVCKLLTRSTCSVLLPG
jgi:hypothetical protein